MQLSRTPGNTRTDALRALLATPAWHANRVLQATARCWWVDGLPSPAPRRRRSRGAATLRPLG